MRKAIILALALVSGAASAQVNNAAQSSSASDAGAIAHTGAITFEAAEPLRHQSVSTTPSLYVAPSMFGGQNNCGQSSTATVGVTGFGLGGSVASESDSCNARADTSTAWNLGFKDVATLRFFCFGESANRLAYEAAGYKCPDGATAQGAQQASAARSRRDMAEFYGAN